MTVGLHAVNLANKILNHVRGSGTAAGAAFTQPTNLYAALHLADPGGAGTTSPSVVTTRSQVVFAAAASGSMALTGTNPSWAMTTTETISHISIWDASTAGNFLRSYALTASRAVVNGDTLTLNSLTFDFTPIAS